MTEPIKAPLYGLEFIAKVKFKPVLVVASPEAAAAAKTFAGHVYGPITWPVATDLGPNGWEQADWKPLYGRKVLIWPINTASGIETAQGIALLLSEYCSEIKIIDVTNEPSKWDAAAALSEGMDYGKFAAWAKPRARLYIPKAQIINPAPKPATQTDNGSDATDSQDSGDIRISTSHAAFYEQMGMSVNGAGAAICNMDNVLRIFQRWKGFKDLVWFDEFHQKFFTTWRSVDAKPREWTDVDDLRLTACFQRELGMAKLSDDLLHKAIIIYANNNIRNEPKDWMESIRWDGTERINNFFTSCFGASESDYSQAASKNWWLSMVARIYWPGSKVDNMVILEGAQGKFKSTALGVIGGPWYAEAHESVTSKDFFMTLQGKLILEISELDSFSKAEVNTIKKTITCQTDRYRPPYGRIARDFPRQCVFVGSTNDENYLRDHTGARRFWPVKTGVIDVPAIRRDREQLFAEAVARYKAGDTWHEMPVSAKDIQESRRAHDEWEATIEEFLSGETDADITISMIAMGALKLRLQDLDLMTQRRIGKILRQLGWNSQVARRTSGSVRVFMKEEAPF